MLGVLKAILPFAAETSPGGDEPPRWVTVAIVNWAEAEVMRSKLESNAVPCLLQRESAGAAMGITIGPLGEVKVLVPASFADYALDLLSDTETNYEADSIDEADSTVDPDTNDPADDASNKLSS